jgi:hypothetical protein
MKGGLTEGGGRPFGALAGKSQKANRRNSMLARGFTVASGAVNGFANAACGTCSAPPES